MAIPVIHLCQRRGPDRKAQFTTFGAIEIAGQRYDHDVVIDGGKIRKRAKKASKAYRAAEGHTPLSLAEHLPWGAYQACWVHPAASSEPYRSVRPNFLPSTPVMISRSYSDPI